MDSLDILVITFNCGRQLVKPEIFARHLSDAISSSSDPNIIVLCLQEIAPIAYSFLGGSYLVPYLSRFRHALHLAGKASRGHRYVNLFDKNVGMTACMVFIHEKHKSMVQSIETGGVGVGVQEMANKGAVGVRLRYTALGRNLDITFVAAHLAPMEWALGERNEDWKNIVRGLVFMPTNTEQLLPATRPPGLTDESESLLSNASSSPRSIYTPTSHLVLAGDLNYRTSSTAPHASDHLAFPQPTSSPTDPHHYSHLLRSDQLTRERKAGRTCHGLHEAPIDFPPTYKYSKKAQLHTETDDAKRNQVWEWAKHRWPSWCDRILFLDLPGWMKREMPEAKVEVQKYTSLPLMPMSDHRPVLLALRVPLKAIPLPEEGQRNGDDVRIHPPFAIDPRWRERRAAARRKEVVVGLLAYVFLTWEGNGILLALAVGILGGWAVVRNMLEV